MHHYKEVEIPAKPAIIEERLEKVTCDICKNTIHEHCYNVDKVEIEREEGTRHPEGASIERTSFDCCGNCFDAHIVPLFKSFGAEPRIEDENW